MTKLAKFSGNYIQVINALKLPVGAYKPSARAIYSGDIDRDLNRTAYVNVFGNVAGMKKRLADVSELKDEDLAYAQGDFIGAVFSENKMALEYATHVAKAAEEGTQETYKAKLAFCYVDDDGRLCGVSLAYLRDDSDRNILADERPLKLALSAIHDVKAPPAKRQVATWMHPDFLKEPDLEPGNNTGKMAEEPKPDAKLGARAAADELLASLNSVFVKKLLGPVFKPDGSIDLEQYRALEKRVRPDHNLDDRDVKIAKLLEIYSLWLRLLANPANNKEQAVLQAKITQYMVGAFTDLNFLAQKNLAEIQGLVTECQTHPQLQPSVLPELNLPLNDYAEQAKWTIFADMQDEISTHFLERNAGPLLLVAALVLATICLALSLTGALAPFGVMAGLMALGAVAEMKENEAEHRDKKKTAAAYKSAYQAAFFALKPAKEEPAVAQEDASAAMKNSA